MEVRSALMIRFQKETPSGRTEDTAQGFEVSLFHSYKLNLQIVSLSIMIHTKCYNRSMLIKMSP